MNVEFLAATYILGKSVDYIVQTQQDAENKTKNKWILSWHSYIYAGTTTGLVYLIFSFTFIQCVYLFLALFFTHWIIDTRKPVKYIMHLKGIKYEEMDTKYGWLQISIDQRLHELVILVLAMVI